MFSSAFAYLTIIDSLLHVQSGNLHEGVHVRSGAHHLWRWRRLRRWGRHGPLPPASLRGWGRWGPCGVDQVDGSAFNLFIVSVIVLDLGGLIVQVHLQTMPHALKLYATQPTTMWRSIGHSAKSAAPSTQKPKHVCIRNTPPPSFPTPGKTVPHHPLGDGHQVTVPHPPLGDCTTTVHHICRHRSCSIKRKHSA